MGFGMGLSDYRGKVLLFLKTSEKRCIIMETLCF